ncbi:hypothetical protein BS78_02G024700 [Paspalum vaginatum]|nr:hypothetical protein BS78_02G024700 [Paspalum vaginatum]
MAGAGGEVGSQRRRAEKARSHGGRAEKGPGGSDASGGGAGGGEAQGGRARGGGACRNRARRLRRWEEDEVARRLRRGQEEEDEVVRHSGGGGRRWTASGSWPQRRGWRRRMRRGALAWVCVGRGGRIESERWFLGFWAWVFEDRPIEIDG